jgi:glucosyl-3-phosphoglycerate synthase
LVRPLFSLFFPELAFLIQPLSGEYSGRRALLEKLAFSTGYGVELGHLIDILKISGCGAIAQVDLDMRIHRNQSTAALSKMAYGILNTFFSRAEKNGLAKLLGGLGTSHIALETRQTLKPEASGRYNSEHRVIETEISSQERPPMLQIPEYLDKFHKAGTTATGVG